jgi:hypothetical protein
MLQREPINSLDVILLLAIRLKSILAMTYTDAIYSDNTRLALGGKQNNDRDESGRYCH